MQKFNVGNRVWYAEKDRMKLGTVTEVMLHGGVYNYKMDSGVTRRGKETVPAEIYFVSLFNTETRDLELITAFSEDQAIAGIRERIQSPEMNEMTLRQIQKWSKSCSILIDVFEAKPKE
jgi:hypothetical protein